MPFFHCNPPVRFEEGCEDCLYEAWELMTFGGLKFRYGKSPTYPVIIGNIGGQHTWVPLVVR